MGKVFDIHSGAETYSWNPLPNKQYEVILADPNWNFKTFSDEGKGRSADRHYHTATIDEIAEIPIENISADNCALFMWVTDPVLKSAIALGEYWGYTYKTVAFTWVKQNKVADSFFMGMGYYTRSNPEMCLLFTKGKPLKRLDKGIRQLIVEPVREHSRKPDCVKDRIVKLFGDVPKIELFAREIYDAKNWDYWGNEITKFNDDEIDDSDE